MHQSIIVAREWDEDTRTISGILPPMTSLADVQDVPLVVCAAITGWLGSPDLRLDVLDVTEGRTSRRVYKSDVYGLSALQTLDLDSRVPLEKVWHLPPGVLADAGSFRFCLMRDHGLEWATSGWVYPVLVVDD